ncbi:hypothetical protein F0562_025504 [Nyssa sinensis]|uniref:Smr domain-containing protein n=1 Tax=Nyssa sinensis TaxID=561372 RepID=A0A5J5BA32_9ASTE|nr:hypothetical protein F0562_025504 [Nyssa sinensis]
MWRSVVAARRSSLSKHAGAGWPLLKLLSVQNHPPQVPHFQTLILIQFPSPSHFSTPAVSPKAPLYQNPRFFSHDSLNHSSNDNVEPHIESPISVTNEDHAFSDRTSPFDEIPCSVSSEFVEPASSSILDETSDTLMRDGFVSGDDKSVEGETHEVDLEQLESVLSLLQSSGVVGSLESSLDSMDLNLHEEFVIRVLETPFIPGENLIEFFKWASKKPEFSVTTQAVDALVCAICSGLRKKDAYALWDFIKEVGEKENGLLNTEILNELISLFSRLGKGKAGFEVFNKFGEFGCNLNAETYYFTIEALCRRSIFDWACSVCEKMLNARDLPDNERIGKIISYLCKGSKAKDAHFVYLLAKEMNRYPPRSCANFLISSLCREDETVHLALEMLEDFSGEERKYAIKPFSSVVRGLSRIKDVEGANKLLFKMIDAGPPPGNAVFNSIINSLSKAGDMEEAMKMMKIMESRGLKPDVYTYSVIMSGYAKGGGMDQACRVLAEAKQNHSKLTPVTYHTLIRGYCKLEEFDKALTLLAEMKEYGVQPNADEYNKLIQSLCLKALNWATAEKLLEEMKENGLHLNGITKGLIRAVRELEEEEGKSEEDNGKLGHHNNFQKIDHHNSNLHSTTTIVNHNGKLDHHNNNFQKIDHHYSNFIFTTLGNQFQDKDSFSLMHVPGFIERVEELKSTDVDEILIDEWVLWRKTWVLWRKTFHANSVYCGRVLQKLTLEILKRLAIVKIQFCGGTKPLMKTVEKSATDLTTLLIEIFNRNESLQKSPLYIVPGSFEGKHAVTFGLPALKAIEARKLKLNLGGNC